MSVQTWFSSDEIIAQPGAQVVVPLSIHNLGDSTESYTIIPAGLTASWTTVARGNVTLFGGSQDVIDVLVTPPMIPTTSAGPNVVAVRVIPQSNPDDVAVAEIVLAVQPFDDRRIVTLQPVQRARRRSNYEFMVENHGNGLASCRLRLIDASERIDGSFDPPAVGVAPGGASLVRLKAKAKRGFFRRSTRTLGFEVEAEQQGHEPAIGAMSLVQPPTIPGAAIVKALTAAAVVGAVVASWFHVVKPAIEDAADQRVDEIAAAQQPPDPDNPTPVTTIVDEPIIEVPEVEGDPTDYRLDVRASLTGTADESFTIPDDEVFDLTDLRIENPFNESGIARLAIDGEVKFEWSLANIRGSYFEPRITPIRIGAGSNVTFSVRCDTIGNAAAGTCTTAINIAGRVRPAE